MISYLGSEQSRISEASHAGGKGYLLGRVQLHFSKVCMIQSEYPCGQVAFRFSLGMYTSKSGDLYTV